MSACPLSRRRRWFPVVRAAMAAIAAAVVAPAMIATAVIATAAGGESPDEIASPPDSLRAPPSTYRDLSASDTGFHGPGRELPDPTGLTSVRIGVLAPGRTEAGERLREGVALAVEEANARGGYRGLPYEVVFRADDGPWGMGAKQVTALAYEDSTWVIVGGLEGGDAHLAELVVAKLWVPVVTPTAGDLSIDYANVPWVFRCFPSDDRQARLLLGWAAAHGCARVVVFAEDDREGLTGTRRLSEAAESGPVELVGPRAFRPHLAGEAVDPAELAAADAAVVWARPDAAITMLREIRRSGFVGPVLAPASFLSAAVESSGETWGSTESEGAGEIVVAAALDPGRTDSAWLDFASRYRRHYGRSPDAVSLFSYDAACLTLAAIERAGLNRARIRDELADTAHEGIAGMFRFDGLGGASLEPVLVTRQGGSWVRAADGGRSRAAGRAD